jgi:hypothetical protein
VPATLGEVVVTTAGTLPAQYIFHAVTIGAGTEKTNGAEIVQRTTRRCLQLLATLDLGSIAFPAIGSGSAGFRYEDVATNMAEVICDEVVRIDKALDVTIYLFNRYAKTKPMDFFRFFEEFAVRVPRLKPSGPIVGPKPIMREPSALATALLDQGTQGIRARRLHGLNKLINTLEDHSLKIEEDLLSALDSNEEERAAKIRKRLKDNGELRLGYYSELKALRADSENSAPTTDLKTVFVSSTYLDLKERRELVKDQIARHDLLFRGMEHFGADPLRTPSTKIVEEVRKADIYLGIFGARYGSIDPATGMSMTELEYTEAAVGKKPMLLYVIRQDAKIRMGDVESIPESRVKLENLKARILRDHVAYQFATAEDLMRQAYEDLVKLVGAGSPGTAPSDRR